MENLLNKQTVIRSNSSLPQALLIISAIGLSLCLSATAGVLEVSKGTYDKYVEAVNANGDTIPAKELKKVLLKIATEIERPEVINARKNSRTLDLLLRSYEISLHHVNLSFTNHAATYPYKIPYKEPLPIRYTLNVVEDGLEILGELEKVISGFQGSEDLAIKPGELTWFDIIKNSNFNLYQKRLDLTGVSLDLETKDAKSVKFEEFFSHPAETYRRLHKRLILRGENASFPEFAPTVGKFLKELESKEVMDSCKDDPLLANLRESIQKRLRYLKQPAGEVPIKTARKMTGRFPYRASIETIAKATQFFDIIERKKYSESSDYFAVEKSWYDGSKKKLLPPPYHQDRYSYHWISLAEDPNALIIPTSRELNFQNLIDVRVAPIEFLGAETQTVRGDRYFNAPFDFWWHDVNHSRRMQAYTDNYFATKKITRLSDRYAAYSQLETYSKELDRKISTVAVNPKYSSVDADEIKKLMKVLRFETVHETALNPDAESLVKDFLKRPRSMEPFEFMTTSRISKLDLEAIRTGDGNLVSGADVVKSKFTGEPLYVNYILDRSLSMLSNVNNKLRYGFYDSVFDMNESELGKLQYRNPQYVAAAAEELLRVVGAKEVNPKALLQLAETRDGLEELYKAYYSVADRMMLSDLVADQGIDIKGLVRKSQKQRKCLEALHSSELQ